MSSDNPSGADNQQERPGCEQWIVGFHHGKVNPLSTARRKETSPAVSLPGILRGHTPATCFRLTGEEMVLTLWRHRDANFHFRGSGSERNSLSGKQLDLPLEGVIPPANLANNGGPLPQWSAQGRTQTERGTPWEVGSDLLLDPVTTEAKAETVIPVLRDKSMDTVRRQPFDARSILTSYVCGYISGFVDGEGCFCDSMRPNSRVCRCMDRGEHLRPQGVRKIARIVSGMNPSGTRRYTAESIELSLSKVKG